MPHRAFRGYPKNQNRHQPKQPALILIDGEESYLKYR